MKRKRYSDEQIAFAPRQTENGTAVEEVCRKLGVSEATFYRWESEPTPQIHPGINADPHGPFGR